MLSKGRKMGASLEMRRSVLCWPSCGLILAIAFAGCDSQFGVEKGATEDCVSSSNGVDYFAGTPECFGTLPRTRIVGYWTVGPSYSYFYEDKESIKRMYDDQATALSLSPQAELSVEKNLRKGEAQVFGITFMGEESPVLGAYGNGIYKGGVYVRQILEIEEIRLAD